jgi:hypothetical protein
VLGSNSGTVGLAPPSGGHPKKPGPAPSKIDAWRSIVDRVAGEATHTGGATGTVHGAMESGDTAAHFVLDSLAPKIQRIRGPRG